MKNALDGLCTSKKRISELKDLSTRTFHNKIQRENRRKKKTKKEHQKNCGTVSKDVTYVYQEYQRRRENGTGGIFEVIMAKNLLKWHSHF